MPQFMELRRSGSIGLDDEDRCCAYNTVWKMLMFHPVYKDIQVATNIKREKVTDLKQFQDLNIMKPSKTNDRKSLHQIMQKHGYKLQALKYENGRKVQQNHYAGEMFDKERRGMYVCCLTCKNGGSTHAICIAKDECGNGTVYDSNFDEPLQMTMENLGKCLGNTECRDIHLIVELVKQRVKNLRNKV